MLFNIKLKHKALEILILTADCMKRCQEYPMLPLPNMAVMSIWWNCLCIKLIVLLWRMDFSSVCPCTNKWLANTTDVRPTFATVFLTINGKFCLSVSLSVCLFRTPLPSTTLALHRHIILFLDQDPRIENLLLVWGQRLY